MLLKTFFTIVRVRPWRLSGSFLRCVIVRLLAHRSTGAASALLGPWGSVSWKLVTGWSGTVLNVLLVMPRFADKRFAVQVDRDAVALQDDDQFGELRTAVTDKIRRSLQRDRQDRCERLGRSYP